MNAQELTQLAERLTHERTFARKMIADIGDGGWATPIPAPWQTAGFVQELVKVANEDMDRDPPRSLRLAQLAVTIAGTIKEGTYPITVHRQLEGSAWLQVAKSHRNMSQYEAALRALERAEARFASSAALGHDLAVATYQRAIIASEMRHFDDSARLFAEVMPILESFGDKTRLRDARYVTAINFFRSGQYRRALEILESIVDQYEEEPATRVMVLNTLGGTRRELGDVEGAIAAFQRSLRLANELGLRTEVTRAEWSTGRLLMVKGDWHGAVDLITRARDEFRGHHLPEEAALCALDLVECLVALDRIPAATAMTSTVINEFVAARLNERAMTALFYMRELLRDEAKAAHVVRHVRTYITRLKDEPELLFLAPPQ